ncbi:ribonuclease P protein component [Candidatus Dojkabacteria bacterium]|nr:ribonuclease P protein component [Candidatus Dojkabacteria bacterium]
MFPKNQKLSSKEFKYVYERGFKVKGEFGMLIGLTSPDISTYKVGFVVNSKIGNAVYRHLATRRLRSVFREILSKETPPLLYEYVAFKYPDKYESLKAELSKQIKEVQAHFKIV